VLILPPLTAAPLELLSLAQEMVESGGTVLALGRLPVSSHVSAVDRDLLNKIEAIWGSRARRLASGEIERLAIGGLPLGPFPNARYTAGLCHFREGDTLVMYSDGITEAHGVGEIEFGMDRLEDLVVGLRHLAPEVLVEKIFAEVSAFSGGEQAHDDQTVLVVQWCISPEAVSH